jgi:hypothetical protein
MLLLYDFNYLSVNKSILSINMDFFSFIEVCPIEVYSIDVDSGALEVLDCHLAF